MSPPYFSSLYLFVIYSAITTMTSAGDALKPQYTAEEIEVFNKQLDGKTPQEVLTWAIDNLDGLYQTTAFGL